MTLAILETVVLPVIEKLGGGEPAVQLVYRTGLAESGYRTTRQYGGGPALGYWQMEPATHLDIWDNFLAYRKELMQLLLDFGETSLVPPSPDGLESNSAYACAMCRVHYMRVAAALPEADDLDAQAAYWKQHYNTPLGAGTVEHFKEAVNGSDI